jgi:hypothetical protein
MLILVGSFTNVSVQFNQRLESKRVSSYQRQTRVDIRKTIQLPLKFNLFFSFLIDSMEMEQKIIRKGFHALSLIGGVLRARAVRGRKK